MRVKEFKSPLPVLAGIFLRSRETQARRSQRLTRELQQLRHHEEQQQALGKQAKDEAAVLRAEVRRLQEEMRTLENQPVRLPLDPVLPSHGYGPRMISLSINLAQKVGLRGAEAALTLFWDWLGVTEKVPHWTTIRTWMQRAGVAAIDEPIEPADDWVWMADHSCQIGPEKALVVLAVQASKLPPPGTALKHEDVHVLSVQPGTQ